jgi:cellulose synthase/poly-beta-1,6-N-acetylglucosamine synthase-like glycosyltransferase
VAVGLGFPLLAGIGLAIAFFCAILLRLSAAAMSFGPSISGPGLPDAELPVYTIIIALYREEAIVRHLLAALERLDYPRAKLDTKIVVEADDVQTIAALRAVRTRFRFEIIVAPRGVPRTKPRALNVALPFAHGALTCVFDAEDEPEPLQLRRAAEIFAKAALDIGCLQARLVVDNYADNWLTRGIMAQTPQDMKGARSHISEHERPFQQVCDGRPQRPPRCNRRQHYRDRSSPSSHAGSPLAYRRHAPAL